MSSFNAKRDARVADDHIADRTLLCRANGCPNRWSVDAGQGRCCSAHAWASQSQWPQITQEQLDAETDRALAKAARVAQPAKVLSLADKRAILRRISGLTDEIRQRREREPMGWAHSLRDQERNGARLTDAQRTAWRNALGAHAVLDAAVDGLDISPERITDALQATGDLPTATESPWTERYVPTFDEPMDQEAA